MEKELHISTLIDKAARLKDDYLLAELPKYQDSLRVRYTPKTTSLLRKPPRLMPKLKQATLQSWEN